MKKGRLITFCQRDGILGRLSSWCRFTSEMIWVKILQGELMIKINKSFYFLKPY